MSQCNRARPEGNPYDTCCRESERYHSGRWIKFHNEDDPSTDRQIEAQARTFTITKEDIEATGFTGGGGSGRHAPILAYGYLNFPDDSTSGTCTIDLRDYGIPASSMVKATVIIGESNDKTIYLNYDPSYTYATRLTNSIRVGLTLKVQNPYELDIPVIVVVDEVLPDEPAESSIINIVMRNDWSMIRGGLQGSQIIQGSVSLTADRDSWILPINDYPRLNHNRAVNGVLFVGPASTEEALQKINNIYVSTSGGGLTVHVEASEDLESAATLPVWFIAQPSETDFVKANGKFQVIKSEEWNTGGSGGLSHVKTALSDIFTSPNLGWVSPGNVSLANVSATFLTMGGDNIPTDKITSLMLYDADTLPVIINDWAPDEYTEGQINATVVNPTGAGSGKVKLRAIYLVEE